MAAACPCVSDRVIVAPFVVGRIPWVPNRDNVL